MYASLGYSSISVTLVFPFCASLKSSDFNLMPSLSQTSFLCHQYCSTRVASCIVISAVEWLDVWEIHQECSEVILKKTCGSIAILRTLVNKGEISCFLEVITIFHDEAVHMASYASFAEAVFHFFTEVLWEDLHHPVSNQEGR